MEISQYPANEYLLTFNYTELDRYILKAINFKHRDDYYELSGFQMVFTNLKESPMLEAKGSSRDTI